MKRSRHVSPSASVRACPHDLDDILQYWVLPMMQCEDMLRISSLSTKTKYLVLRSAPLASILHYIEPSSGSNTSKAYIAPERAIESSHINGVTTVRTLADRSPARSRMIRMQVGRPGSCNHDLAGFDLCPSCFRSVAARMRCLLPHAVKLLTPAAVDTCGI